MSRRNLLLVSSSRCHPHRYLDHCADEAIQLFRDCASIVFIPYARPGGTSHDAYTTTVRERFELMGKSIRGIHEFDNSVAAIENADGVFIGGGNTFVLLRDLYQNKLVEPLRDRILDGMPYMGTSAGSNVAGMSIGTSNDMPIVYPPSFAALAVIPFNINPHYPATDPDPTHMGETRGDRIGEFHVFDSQSVIAIREDGMLRVKDNQMALLGERSGLVFSAGRKHTSLSPGDILHF
jgi:dipeptidase E